MFILCIASLPAFSEIPCPKCSFQNQDEDRYCLNCMTELKTLSQEEKNRMEKINRERRASTQKNISRQIRRKAQSTPRSTSSGSSSGSSFTGKAPLLHLRGKSVKIGMKKPLLRKKLKYESTRYPYSGSTWKVYGSSGYQTAKLHFSGKTLTRWESNVYYDYFIKRDFPLNRRDLKTGMSESAIRSMWGGADIRHESCSESTYHLSLEYYVEEPRTELDWERSSSRSNFKTRLENRFAKIGPVFELTFDTKKQLTSIREKPGSKRVIERPMMDPRI